MGKVSLELSSDLYIGVLCDEEIKQLQDSITKLEASVLSIEVKLGKMRGKMSRMRLKRPEQAEMWEEELEDWSVGLEQRQAELARKRSALERGMPRRGEGAALDMEVGAEAPATSRHDEELLMQADLGDVHSSETEVRSRPNDIDGYACGGPSFAVLSSRSETFPPQTSVAACS